MSGIPFPEFTLRRLIDQAITTMLSDERILADAFAELPVDEQRMIRSALGRSEGRVRLGWGQEVKEDWCVTVVLAGTAKDGRGTLGDIVSRPVEVALAMRALTAELSAQANVVPVLSAPVSAPAQVDERGLVRFRDLVTDEIEYATYQVTNGVCTVRQRAIVLNGATPRAWPIGTEVMFFEWEQREGWPEIVTLRCDVGGVNALFVMALSRIIQAFIGLAAGTGDFAGAGYTLSECNATDLAPRPPIWPAQFFNRTLHVQFRTTLSLPAAYPALAATDITMTTE